jgi:sugar O-acyltransferase (sialic acid O-acetyltransferase NeuD family)
MDSSRIVIVGCGDHARVVHDILVAQGLLVVGCVTSAAPEGDPAPASDMRCLGDLEQPAAWLSQAMPESFVVAIGRNDARAAAFGHAQELGLTPVAAVHPTAIRLTGAVVRPGAQICAGAILGVDAVVEQNAIVNTGATVDHDNRIGAHASVAPGAHLAGHVIVGTGAFVGIGAVILDGVRVGEWALVAAGATVTSDVPDGVRVAGIPARPMRATGGS